MRLPMAGWFVTKGVLIAIKSGRANVGKIVYNIRLKYQPCVRETYGEFVLISRWAKFEIQERSLNCRAFSVRLAASADSAYCNASCQTS
jgi:hypothetical protein